MFRFPILAILLLATPTHAAQPVVRSLNLRGLQSAGTTTLTFDGDDLTNARLLLPFPAKQDLKKESTDKRAVLDVQLGADVQPGYYQLWLVTDGGASAPIVVGVDRFPEKPIAPVLDSLPVALHGSVGGAAIVETKFQGKAKQKIIVEVDAQRLGSKLKPIVHLYSPRKLQLAWAWGTPALLDDARLQTELPEDGTYTVTLHDAEYAAPGNGFYRLKIGSWSYVDQIFPPVLGAGKGGKVELLGSNPTVVDVPAPKAAGWLPLAWPKDGIWSGALPFVTVSAHAEFLQQPGKMLDLPQGHVGVSGKLLAPFGEDRYKLAVTPGKKIKLEVFAERLGSPLDAALVIRNDKDAQLARAEDGPDTLDPVLEYAVPEKVESVIVGVVDAQGRGGPHCIYRLVVEPQGAAAAPEDFRLSTTGQNHVVPVGGRVVFPVYLDRAGYQGKVALTANLPKGVRIEGNEILEGTDGTLISLERAAEVFPPQIVAWQGRGKATEQPVFLKDHPLERLQPWLASEIALAPANDKAADFRVDWGDKLPGLVPGIKMVLPVKLMRTDPKATVKLSLLTSQNPPLTSRKPDPAKTIRLEKAVEVPVKIDVADLSVVVPAEATEPSYQFSIQAELLGPGKKVQAVAYAPVRRFALVPPLVVRLDGQPRVEAGLEAKKESTLKIPGKLERAAGVKGDVALTLTGLPAGARAAAVTLKEGTNAFVFELVLPANQAAGEVKGLKIAATAAPDPPQPNARIKSAEVEITLVLRAPK